MTDTLHTIDSTQRVLLDMLRSANGAEHPSMIKMSIGDSSDLPDVAYDIGDRCQRLHVSIDRDGRITAAVGIPTHWKTLWSRGLRFCIAPSGQLFLQSFATPPIYLWVEDGRFLMDRGSLLPTMIQRRGAAATFDADFAALMAGAL